MLFMVSNVHSYYSVEKDLDEVINHKIKEVVDEENIIYDRFLKTIATKFTSEKEIVELLNKKVLAGYEELIRKIAIIKPKTKNVLKVLKIYINALKRNHNTIIEYVRLLSNKIIKDSHRTEIRTPLGNRVNKQVIDSYNKAYVPLPKQYRLILMEKSLKLSLPGEDNISISGKLGKFISLLPVPELRNLPGLLKLFRKIQELSIRKPGNTTYDAAGPSYNPTLEELELEAVGDRIEAIIHDESDEMIITILKKENIVEKEIMYKAFTSETVKVFGTGFVQCVVPSNKKVILFK